MRQKKTTLILSMLMLLIGAPLLSACHTTAGAGEDISATGQAIKKSADQNTP
jgi:predicted small secreted protein